MAVFSDKKSFVRWVMESETEDVLLRRSIIVKYIPFVMDEDTIHECGWAVRVCEEELGARGIKFPKKAKKNRRR